MRATITRVPGPVVRSAGRLVAGHRTAEEQGVAGRFAQRPVPHRAAQRPESGRRSRLPARPRRRHPPHRQARCTHQSGEGSAAPPGSPRSGRPPRRRRPRSLATARRDSAAAPCSARCSRPRRMMSATVRARARSRGVRGPGAPGLARRRVRPATPASARSLILVLWHESSIPQPRALQQMRALLLTCAGMAAHAELRRALLSLISKEIGMSQSEACRARISRLYVVTGAGPVGWTVAEQFAAAGRRVRVLTRSGSGPAHPLVEKISDRRFGPRPARRGLRRCRGRLPLHPRLAVRREGLGKGAPCGRAERPRRGGRGGRRRRLPGKPVLLQRAGECHGRGQPPAGAGRQARRPDRAARSPRGLGHRHRERGGRRFLRAAGPQRARRRAHGPSRRWPAGQCR